MTINFFFSKMPSIILVCFQDVVVRDIFSTLLTMMKRETLLTLKGQFLVFKKEDQVFVYKCVIAMVFYNLTNVHYLQTMTLRHKLSTV